MRSDADSRPRGEPRLQIVRESRRHGFVAWRRALYTVYELRDGGYRHELLSGWFRGSEDARAEGYRLLARR